MSSFTRRVEQIEKAQGLRLPADYLGFLSSHQEAGKSRDEMVASNPDAWGVRHVFEVGSGAPDIQLDEVVRLVGDVIPLGTLPVAEDEAGNLYLLDCASENQRGKVLWWDHEKITGENLEVVAQSFRAFLEQLVPAD
jgi:hypothetical protein